jgi:serine/threonine protein kinase
MLKVVQGSTHIVNLVEIIEETDTEKTFIVMELLEDENLLSRVVQSDGLDEATVKTIVRDLLHGIQHLHGLGITHNNLHPSNVLTVNHDENGDDEGFHVKIADFGHASGDESVNNSTVSNSNTERSTKTSRTIFQAPENTTSQASDMWSVGAILCFCITGGQILQEKSHEALVRKLQGDLGKTSSKYAALSRCGKQLLCGLLHTDPTVRLTVSEALEHTWFTDAENQSGISTSEGVQWNRGRGRKPSSRKVREHVSSEPLLRSSTTFTRSVTKMVQHFSYRKL